VNTEKDREEILRGEGRGPDAAFRKGSEKKPKGLNAILQLAQNQPTRKGQKRVSQIEKKALDRGEKQRGIR